LLVPLDLAVAFRGARGDEAVVDVLGGEDLGERVVAGVAPGVVGLQALGLDVVGGVERQGTLDERGDGVRFLVGVDFGVGQSCVVVDD
jgi:hypothetical protein